MAPVQVIEGHAIMATRVQVVDDVANHVIDRILQGNNLTGVIPSAWTSNNTFAALTSLDLSENSLAGELSKASELTWF